VKDGYLFESIIFPKEPPVRNASDFDLGFSANYCKQTGWLEMYNRFILGIKIQYKVFPKDVRKEIALPKELYERKVKPSLPVDEQEKLQKELSEKTRLFVQIFFHRDQITLEVTSNYDYDLLPQLTEEAFELFELRFNRIGGETIHTLKVKDALSFDVLHEKNFDQWVNEILPDNLPFTLKVDQKEFQEMYSKGGQLIKFIEVGGKQFLKMKMFSEVTPKVRGKFSVLFVPM